MHYLLRVELFFSKQYNKSALLCFLLAVWNCVICTPGASSPSKKAKEASGDEPSSPATASLHGCSFAIGPCSFLSVPSCFQLPLHPSVLWVSGSKSTQRGFQVVNLLRQMWGTKRDLNSHLFFSAPWTLDSMHTQRHALNPQPFWQKPPERSQVPSCKSKPHVPLASTSPKQALRTPKPV